MHMMHKCTVITVPHSCYAKTNLSPPEHLHRIAFLLETLLPRTVIMCLARLSTAPISYKYAAPARL